MQIHASVLLTGRMIQEYDHLCRTEGNEDEYSGTESNLDIPDLYNPSLLWTFSPLPWSPSFNSLSENSSFHIYCSLKAATNSSFSPNQSERTEILQQTHTHSWQEPPHTLSQTVYAHFPTFFSTVKMTFKQHPQTTWEHINLNPAL